MCIRDRASTDQDGFITDRSGEFIQVQVALAVHRQEAHRKTFFFKPSAAVQHRRVLDLRGDNMPVPALPPVSDPFKGQVIGFGTA